MEEFKRGKSTIATLKGTANKVGGKSEILSNPREKHAENIC